MPAAGWRRPVRRLHEWAGVLAAAGLVVVGVTGAAAVFLGELFRLQYGEMLEVPATQYGQPEVPLDRLVVSATAGYGAGFSPQGVLMPHSRIPLDVALIYGTPQGADAAEPLMLAVNPYTGAYQGSFWLDDALGHELVHLHADLLAGEGGRLVVVGLGVAIVLFAASGLCLWWPRSGAAGAKLFATTFRRRPSSVFVLHGLLGIWLGPLLIFYALTGIATAKPQWFSPLMVSPFAQAPDLPEGGEGGSSRPWLPLSRAVALGGAELPDRRLASVHLAEDGRLVGMTFKGPGDLDRYYGDGHAWVDRQGGRVLESFVVTGSPATAAGAVMHSLHSGLYFGVPGMVASVLTGLGLAVASGLGLVLWWRRWRDSRQRSGRGRAHARFAPEASFRGVVTRRR